MRRVSYIKVSAFACGILGLAGFAGDQKLSAQASASVASQFEIGSFRHETHAELQNLIEAPERERISIAE